MTAPARDLLCPSAQPDMPGAQVLGVVEQTADGPRLAYLNATVRVGPELLELAAPAPPLRVMRIAASCNSQHCAHFDGQACSLAQRVTERLHPVGAALPPCVIRRRCRWYAEQGAAACLRCAQVVTETDAAAIDPMLMLGANGRVVQPRRRP